MSQKHVKDFDTWNKVKKRTEEMKRRVFAHPREVWWCSLGVNIGVEADGKNENFERPVLVVKVYNKQSMLVLPLTSKIKQDKFHASFVVKEIDQKTNKEFTKTIYVKLTQARVISNKRLLRKVDVVDQTSFDCIVKDFREFI